MTTAGFTLVEILVVLAIIALVVAVLPSPFGGLSTIRLRAAADEMVDVLRRLHDLSMRQGIVTEIIVDPKAKTFTLSGSPQVHPFPPVVDAVASTRQRVASDDGMLRIRFFADGTATGETMKLIHGGSARQITVDWLTGRARRDD